MAADGSALPIGSDLAGKPETVYTISILRHRWTDSDALNAALIDSAKRDRAKGGNYAKTNRLGWRSAMNATQSSAPDAYAMLEERATRLVNQLAAASSPEGFLPGDEQGWMFEMWANFNPPGAYNISHAHTHNRCIWSGVYYADTGYDSEDTATGSLVLEDRSFVGLPVTHGRSVYRREIEVKPVNGLMVIFPAWLYHRVEPYHGPRERLSFAFNFYSTRHAVPAYKEIAKYKRTRLEILKEAARALLKGD
jgi:uncharacterized protein (TIGR02466 family)